MSQKIYACFDTQEHAKAAINQLIKGGVQADKINFACKAVQAEGLNPAQNDYPMPEAGGSTAVSSAPPSANRDFNPGIEADKYNESYKGDVDRDMHKQLDAVHGNHPGTGPAPNEAYRDENLVPRGSEQGDVDLDNQQFGAMAGTFPDLRAPGPGSSQAGGGDAFAASLGTRSVNAAPTANATTHPGGMSDMLWSSLPVDLADYYREQFEDGKAILVVDAEDDASAVTAENLLRSEGAARVQRNSYMA